MSETQNDLVPYYFSARLLDGRDSFAWGETRDPMRREMGGHTGGYSAVYSGSGLVVQERMGWGDEPAPQFRVTVGLGRETYTVHADALPAVMDLLADWAPTMLALVQLQE